VVRGAKRYVPRPRSSQEIGRSRSPWNDPALLIHRIRDEAHRCAVTFHRKARSMRDLRSELDAFPGIGASRRRALLTRFGSLAAYGGRRVRNWRQWWARRRPPRLSTTSRAVHSFR
jgi:excinuclease ABC subunit C